MAEPLIGKVRAIPPVPRPPEDGRFPGSLRATFILFFLLEQFLLVFVFFRIDFCHDFKDFSLSVSFVELLFLRGPMTLNYDREIAASTALAQESAVSYAFPSNLLAVNCRLSRSV